MKLNDYDQQLTPAEIDAGRHRAFVGGLWDEVGKLQFEFCVSRGLKPGMRFLDIGCGSLRGGVHFIPYLERGRYFGIDANASLIEAGRVKELPLAGLEDKLPPENLRVDAEFRFGLFSERFEMALAQSVFTHLPLTHFRTCLTELSEVTASGSLFFATFFVCPEERDPKLPLKHEPGGLVTHVDSDPYHHRLSDIRRAAEGLPWDLAFIGNWGHPRDQRMVSATRSSR